MSLHVFRSALLVCAMTLGFAMAGCADDAEVCRRGPASCADAPAPSWQLADMQPESARYEQVYGLEGFRGQVVVMLMIDSLCDYCGSAAEAMNRMQGELRAEGYNVVVVGLLRSVGASSLPLLLETASYPIFVDTNEVNAWQMQGGGNSDMFIYGPSGRLLDHIGVDDGRGMFVVLPQGYAKAKAAITALADSVHARTPLARQRGS